MYNNSQILFLWCACRMPIFLFNYTDKMMHGIFRAVTPGTQNINPYGKLPSGSCVLNFEQAELL